MEDPSTQGLSYIANSNSNSNSIPKTNSTFLAFPPQHTVADPTLDPKTPKPRLHEEHHPQLPGRMHP